MVSRRSFLRAGMGMAGLAAAGGVLLPTATAQAQPATSLPPWQQLRGALTGTLVLPGDSDYDSARQLDSDAYDTICPQAIAYCATAADVRTCLLFVQDQDIQLAVRSGGHCAAGYSTGTGLVLDTSRLNQITIGPATVTIGPGAQGVDLLNTLSASGLSVVSGNCPTVCTGGYLQGGGIGPLARKFGVASDHLVSAEVVLADGRSVRCSASREPELFWALRGGGGGNFGVVTSFEVKPVSAPLMVTFNLSWPWTSAAEVIAAELPWQSSAPDCLMANLTIMNMNPVPASVPMVSVSGGWLGSDPTALAPYLDELGAAVGSAPSSSYVSDPNQSYAQALMQQYGCASLTAAQCHRVGYSPVATLPREGFVVERGMLLDRPLSPTAINEALSAFEANSAAGQLRFLSIGGLGGRINQMPRTATAYVHRGAQYYFTYTAETTDPTPTAEERAAVADWANGGFAVTQRYGDGESQVNFIDPNLTDWRQAYYAENYGRLVQAKQHYDPNRLFRFTQAVGS